MCTGCIPNCSTGYRSASSSERISIFHFPRDEQLKVKWLKPILNKNWNLADSHRICAKHFNASDYLNQRLSIFSSVA